MKRLIPIFMILVVGCKQDGAVDARLIESPESTPSPSSTPTPTPDATTCAPSYDLPVANNPGAVTATTVRDANNTAIGFWVEDVGEYTWVKQGGTSYFFGVNTLTGAVKRANVGMVYTDSNCVTPIGVVLDYPLHLSGDAHVFPFEGDWYEYDITAGAYYGPWPTSGSGYYFKTENGICHLCAGTATNVREIIPSSVFGISELYQGPITH